MVALKKQLANKVQLRSQRETKISGAKVIDADNTFNYCKR